MDQLRIPLCPESRCSRRDYHLGGSCWPGSSYQGDGPALAAASGTQISRRIVKWHKGIKGQLPMRFGSLSHEALLQRYERAAFSSKQEPWTVLIPQPVATSIEPATGIVDCRRSPCPGLRTVRNLCRRSENPAIRVEERPGCSSTASTLVGATIKLKQVAPCGTVLALLRVKR